MDEPSETTGMHGPSKRQRTLTDAQQGAMEVGRGQQVMVPRSIPVEYNDRFTTELKYVDFYNGEVALGGRDVQVWRPFSTFDPDFTNIGHQPKGRDLWAGLYTHYAVLACEYEIDLYNNYADAITYTAVGTASQDLGLLGAVVNIGLVTGDFGNSMTTQAEMKNAEFAVVPAKGFTHANGESGMHRFKGTITPGDFKMGNINDDGDDTWTAVGSNPNVQRLLGLSIEPLYNANPAGNSEAVIIQWTAAVTLRLTVQFHGITDALRIAAS